MSYWDPTAHQSASGPGQLPSHGHHHEPGQDIRWIYMHMIEEYARHNGHADLIRERIDGLTGD